MLEINIPLEPEYWDPEKEEFITGKEETLRLEHSLISLSKWEEKYKKPFISSEKNKEELIDYIKFMTLNKNVDPNIYKRLTSKNISDIIDYIEDPRTATTFSDMNNRVGRSREQVTSELIYYWMLAYNIPFDECQKWHINRLMTLIRICEIKSEKPKKRSTRELMSRNAALNKARRAKMNSKG